MAVGSHLFHGIATRSRWPETDVRAGLAETAVDPDGWLFFKPQRASFEQADADAETGQHEREIAASTSDQRRYRGESDDGHEHMPQAGCAPMVVDRIFESRGDQEDRKDEEAASHRRGNAEGLWPEHGWRGR